MSGFSNYQNRGYHSSVNLVDTEGNLQAVHRYPMESFVHVLDRDGTCMCGPHSVILETAGGYHITMYTHEEFEAPPAWDEVEPDDDILRFLESVLEDLDDEDEEDDDGDRSAAT